MPKTIGQAAAELRNLREGNHIQNLTATRDELKKKIEACLVSISTFKKHLEGSKYQGTDSDGERKDWISVKDVFRWLDDIESDIR